MTSHCIDFESACGSFLSLLDNRYEEFLVIINQSKVVIFRAWARAWSCNIFVPWWFMIWPLNLVAGPKLTPQERCPVMVKKEKKETLSPWRVEMSIWWWTKKNIFFISSTRMIFFLFPLAVISLCMAGHVWMDINKRHLKHINTPLRNGTAKSRKTYWSVLAFWKSVEISSIVWWMKCFSSET